MGVKLRERPGKGWYVLTDYRGQRKAKFFGKNKAQAEKFADKLTARLKWAEQSGEPIALSRPDQSMPTVETYLKEWLENSVKLYCKQSTYEEYARAIDHHLIPTFGARLFGSLTRGDIMRLVSTCAELGKSRSTIRNYLVPLKAAYNQGIEEGLVTVNPVARVSRLFRGTDAQQMKLSPLSREEVQVLLATAQARYSLLYPLLLCAVRAGLRQGELIGLQWGDVDFRGRFLEVRRAVVDNPRSAGAWGRLGWVYMVHGLSPEAVESLEQASALDDKDYRWPYLIGVTLNVTDQAPANETPKAPVKST